MLTVQNKVGLTARRRQEGGEIKVLQWICWQKSVFRASKFRPGEIVRIRDMNRDIMGVFRQGAADKTDG